MIIDAHHHLWTYDPQRYAWIGSEMEVLKQDFGADELRHVTEAVGVDATIVVQAVQDDEETDWLLDVAHETPEIAGVVGWVDLCDEAVERRLDHITQRALLVGVRHVLQDEVDDAFMLRDDFNRGIDCLATYGLAYDILIYARHLQHARTFVDRHPDQTFVVDHIAKPPIRDGEIDRWRADLTELARREHVYCKLSGVVTEADWTSWSAEHVEPYVEAALEAFGPERLMFGSDWPVCLLATDYASWFHLVRDFTSRLSETERERIFGGTAADAYRLGV